MDDKSILKLTDCLFNYYLQVDLIWSSSYNWEVANESPDRVLYVLRNVAAVRTGRICNPSPKSVCVDEHEISHTQACYL